MAQIMRMEEVLLKNLINSNRMEMLIESLCDGISPEDALRQIKVVSVSRINIVLCECVFVGVCEYEFTACLSAKRFGFALHLCLYKHLGCLCPGNKRNSFYLFRSKQELCNLCMSNS